MYFILFIKIAMHLCIILFSPCLQRLLKSITPEPSSDNHREFIVTNAVWPNYDQKKAPQTTTWSALCWTYCKTTGQGGYLSPSLPLFIHLTHVLSFSLPHTSRYWDRVRWSQAAVALFTSCAGSVSLSSSSSCHLTQKAIFPSGCNKCFIHIKICYCLFM